MRLRFSLWVVVALWIATAAVAQSATNTMLSLTAGGAAVTAVKEGVAVTLSATVISGNSPVTQGQVRFCEVKPAPLQCTDIRLLGAGQLNGSGIAVLTFYPGPGLHTYAASFDGTNAAAPSTGTANLTVQDYSQTTSVITSFTLISPGTYTLDVSVTGDGGVLPATGQISIYNQGNPNNVLGTGTLVPGQPAGGTPAEALFGEAVETPQYGPQGLFQQGCDTLPCLGYIAVGDFNGDGHPDVAVASYEGAAVSSYLGNGSSGFSYGSTQTVAANPASIAVADFNADGKMDLAVTSYEAGSKTPGSVSILLGNGDGTFAPANILPTAMNPWPSSVATGDFNNDGIPDLAVTNTNTSVSPAVSSVNILLGKGDGTFTLAASLPTGIQPLSVIVGDFNGDGNADLAVANGLSNPLTIYLGKGDGTFVPAALDPTTGTSANADAMVAADFNGDGILDLAVANYGSSAPGDYSVPGTIQVLLGRGDGTFIAQPQIYARNHLNSIAVGDFNGDGIADLVVSDLEGEVGYMTGNGDGTFGAPGTQPINLASDGAIYAVATGDFNGDGLSDIVASGNDVDYGFRIINVMPAQVTSVASVSNVTIGPFFVPGLGPQPVVASYPGDANYAPSVSDPVDLVAEQVPTTLSVSANPATSNYGQSVTLSALVSPSTNGDENATGLVAFTIGNTVIGISPIVNGLATFQTTLLPAGIDTITAKYSGDSNFEGLVEDTTATVNGSGSATVLSVLPNPAGAGQTIAVNANVVGVSFPGVPTGSVTFYSGTTSLGQVMLDSNGNASYSIAGLPMGSYALSAVYSGDGGVYGSTSPVVTLVVNAYASTTMLTASPNPAGVGQAVALKAVVNGAGSAVVAAGVVTFYDGTVALGTGMLDASGQAIFTSAALTLGSHSLTAVYAGNATYLGSTSSVYVETLQTPGFSVTLSNSAITLQTYSHATESVTLTSAGDFGDSIVLSCGNVPEFATCVFTPNPVTLTANSTATVSFYLDTDSIPGVSALNTGYSGDRDNQGRWSVAFLWGSPLWLIAGIAGGRRRRRLAVWGMTLLVCMVLPAVIGGCGGSIVSPVPSVAPGTYNIVVTGTGASSKSTSSTMLSLTVTPYPR